MGTKSFYEMALDNAYRSPNAPGFSSLNVELTFSQLTQVVTHISSELQNNGVVPGSRVATTLDSELDLLVILAISKLGAVSCSVPDGVAYLDGLVDLHIVKDTGSSNWRIKGADRLIASTSWIDDGLARDPKQISDIISEFYQYKDSDIVRILLTSGTTGDPKPVCLSHVAMFRKSQILPKYWFEFDKEVSLFPPASIGGTGTLICALVLGKEIFAVLPYTKATVAFSARKGIQAISASPLQVSAFLDYAEELGLGLGNLRRVRLGGGPASEKLVKRLRKLGVSSITSHYGSTECGGLFMRDLLSEDPFNFLGETYSGTELRIAGKLSEEPSLTNTGLLEYKSTSMFSGYLQPDGSMISGTTEDGFYPSGDLVDEISGKFLFKGREDDILNIGGVSLNGHPIELFAKAQSGIEDAVCFVIEDPNGKPWLAMAITAAPKFEIAAFADSLNAEFPRNSPRYISKVSAIPRTDTGKPVRRKLMSLFEASVF